MTRLQRVFIASAVVFFAVTAWYGRPAGLWNSPDETANAFWIERVANGEPRFVRDAVIGIGAGAIHPRSMAVQGDTLVPGSFPGIILLYGALLRIFNAPLFLLTPIFTVLAGALFAAVVGRLFDRRVGIVAAILFFLHPAVLYYASRGLFHNVLFINLLIFSAAAFALRRDRVHDALGGFAFGWALATRTSEALWAVPAFALFLPFAGTERWRRLGWALAGAALPVFLLLQTNASLYGSPFKTAYVSAPAAPTAVETAISAPAPSAQLEPRIALPFGFDAKRALRNAWYYGIRIFWWQSLLAVAGLLLWCSAFRKSTAVQKTYAAATVAGAVWLAVLYGSWAIRDRLDPSAVTIGTSYVRYFLPAYVAMLPFAAFALVRFADGATRKHAHIAVLALFAFMTARVTLFAGDESLQAVRDTLAENAWKRTQLLENVFPPDAVIMTERFDKLFVPDIMRIIPAADATGFDAATKLADVVPVYWYGLTPAFEERLRLEALANARGFTLSEMPSPVSGETALIFERAALDDLVP
ncbi:MAG: hypothetical protein QY323_02570 [Patescibacteria group bacterium]|nr:MAG: hypothetical protein QY323_02570 [Patescibacteria group bacterium]